MKINTLLAICTNEMTRNTKDGVTTLSGCITVKDSDIESPVNASDLVDYLVTEGMAVDAKNDQDQTTKAYFGNLKSNRTYMIQVLSPSRWRILKVVKSNQA